MVAGRSSNTGAGADFVRPADGLVSARIFGDPALYELELERIFTRTWLFVAHESEVPRRGDFVTRRMGGDPVIVCCGADGEVRVFLNVCRHRGRKLCGLDAGRTAAFRCGYHGWTYGTDGELTGVPFFEAYQGKLDKGDLGLLPARVDSYQGLIFATWDPAAESLSDYLGSMKAVIDVTVGRLGGAEVVGPPMRWVARANWKPAAANFVGDALHLFTTHAFSHALGLKAKRTERVTHTAPAVNGHGAMFVSQPNDVPEQPYLALPPELWPSLARHLAPDLLAVLKPLQVLAATIFPNLSFLNTATHSPEEWSGPPGEAVSFLTLRQWQPLGVDRMEAWSWVLVDRAAPAWWKERSQACYQRVFGPAGTFEQDDLANWAGITDGLTSSRAWRLWLQYGMGEEMTPAPDWTGPPGAYVEPPVNDLNERRFYERWQQLIGEPPG
jgi:phenylpropionate dioxygenase-like ring-hydroxylating dioxygenase large terminal subunit